MLRCAYKTRDFFYAGGLLHQITDFNQLFCLIFKLYFTSCNFVSKAFTGHYIIPDAARQIIRLKAR